MRNIISLLFLGLLVSGCYQNSLTYLAPATSGVAQGKVSQSLMSTTLSYSVKEQTGKTPMEHILTETQMRSFNKQKQKLNPCEQNLKLCLSLKQRIENTRKKIILNKEFQETRNQLLSSKKLEISQKK